MSFFSKLLSLFNKKNVCNNGLFGDTSFNQEEYDRYNNKKIAEFRNRYDLTSVAGIRAIPKEEAKRYPDGGKSVVYMPEQILNRQATEYKNNQQYDLAIECLKKANELYPLSFYAYTRKDYERLVDFLVLAGRFDEARIEHEKIDRLYGTRLDELHRLQSLCAEDGSESMSDYQKRIIDPYTEEAKDREQYYWLLEHMPEIAPKSFGGFRRMKKINSQNYRKILEEIRKNGYFIEDLKFWF